MEGVYTILLLICSNIFMTFVWYGNLLLKERHISDNWSMPLIIVASWGIALIEYCFLIPANNIGSEINGGPYNLTQLKVIQEVISVTVFSGITILCFHEQHLQWNHCVAFVLLIAAVFFVFLK